MILMTSKTENHPVNLTVGTAVTQRWTSIEPWESWRKGLVEVEVLIVCSEGAQGTASKLWR